MTNKQCFYKFRSGHHELCIQSLYAILYFGLFEKAVSGFFLICCDKINTLDKCLFGACNNFEGYFDD